MTRWAWMLAVGLAACAGDGGGTTDTCTSLVEGEWTIDGTAMGMPMGATVTLDAADACTFTFSDWSMSMNDLPTGGTVTGTDVQLTGGTWDACTGTVSDDGQSASGTCEDGSDWDMTLGALTTSM